MYTTVVKAEIGSLFCINYSNRHSASWRLRTVWCLHWCHLYYNLVCMWQ